MQIEQLEVLLEEIRKLDSHIPELLELKEASLYTKKSVEIIRLYCPDLEKKCDQLLELCGLMTIQEGASVRLDVIKDSTFDIYGKCIGEKL